MIKKMTKYSIITFQPELMQFLDKLQELGMMDVTRSNRAFDDISKSSFDAARRYKEAIKNLNLFIEKHKDIKAKEVNYEDTESALKTFEQLFSEIPSLNSQKYNLNKETEEASLWGDFSSNDIEKIKEMGLTPHFYQVSEKKYKTSWEDKYPVMKLNTVKGKCCFVIVTPSNEEYSFALQESKFPEKNVNEYVAEIQSINNKIDENIRIIMGLTKYLPDFEKQYSIIMEELDKYFAFESSSKKADNTIGIIEGFAPTESDFLVKEFLDNNDVIYLIEAAKAEDNPPVKLKNNFFAKLFEPIGNLYMLPKYDELDLTPYFAPFYMLFFGLCLGDMGYGLILILISLFVIWKLPKMRGYGKLILMLGIGTVIMPALNGTFFGTKIYDIMLLPDSINNLFFSDIKMFWFAIIFGIFQIIFARLVSAVYAIIKRGWQYGMRDIGWSIILIWISFAYAGSQTGEKILSPIMNYILGGGGLFLVLFFSKTNGNIFKRFIKGVISLYDITGFFGDILSYIRLFGLGTSGGILGMVVNSVAMQLTGVPYIGWGLCIIMLIIGHTFVLLLCSLGAFVHPMRLTFVEFYKNVGFSGGGKEYKPLKKEKE